MLVGDLSEIRSRPVLADPLSASPSDIRTAFLPTNEALRVCAAIVQRAGVPGRKRAGILLGGNPGSGKTHIVRYAEALLTAPGDPGWEVLAPFLGPEQLMPAPVRTLLLPAPADPDVDLAETVSLQLLAQAGKLPPASPVSPGEYGALLAEAALLLVSQSVGMLVLENLPLRLDRAREKGSAQTDVEFCGTLVRAFCEHGILVVITAAQGRLEALERSPLAPLAACCDVVLLSRRNLAETIFSLTNKTEEQSNHIREIVGDMRRNVPLLGTKIEDCVCLYPLHAPLFEAMFEARRFSPGFSPLQFALAALEASRGWPADRLVTLEVLFDHLMPQLRADERLTEEIAALYECELEILTELGPDLAPKATALLKAIAFGTVCGNSERSVKWLTNQVLPGHTSGPGSAYSFVCAVLAEVERCCHGRVAARGGGLERKYRLVARDAVKEGSQSGESVKLRFALMLYDWIHSAIPCWNPESSTKYMRHSQMLTVAAPENQSGRKGIVHFQSAFEPLWSDEDVSALKDSGAEWALLILTPFGRPDHDEARIREITAAWDAILVWRPDTPRRSEWRDLRRIAPAYSLPALSGVRWRKWRAKARKLLHDLYVVRGLLLTSADHWSPSAELENDSLAALLSRTLLSITGSVTEATVPGPPEASPAANGRVLAWAALLSDPAVRPESELSSERHLLSWWATRLEVDCSALVSRLHSLPETFTTIRMGEEIRFFESSLGLIRSALQRLKTRELSLADAIGQIAAHFGNDESRLLKWRKSLDNFAGLTRWLPSYEYARDYIEGAFDTGKREVDERRSTLREAGRHPHRMLESSHRDGFDTGFLQYRKLYAEAYSALHEEAVGRIQARVDASSIRTLELLSRLDYADTTWFQKVQLIAKWARSNQCDLPVRDILDRYPRCYCNFNPSIRQHLSEPGTRINTLVQEGTEYFRNVLRICRRSIFEELPRLRASDDSSRQIASLLNEKAPMPIGPEVVEVLNRVIRKHPDQFRSEFGRKRNTDGEARMRASLSTAFARPV